MTWLFVPGDRPDQFAKAAAAGADQVIIDLEDAISPHAKDQARQAAADWLTAGRECWIRVNAPGTPWHDDDLSTLSNLSALRGIIVPKAEDASDLVELATRVAPGIDLIALVESARGILNAAALTDCEAITRLAFGAIDFALDIDADDIDDALLLARGTLVVTSRAAGKPAPIDSVTANLAPPATATDARRARALGFGGKLLIHPAHVQEAAEAFRPTDAQVEWARGVLDTAGQASNGAVGKTGTCSTGRSSTAPAGSSTEPAAAIGDTRRPPAARVKAEPLSCVPRMTAALTRTSHRARHARC